MGDPSLIAGVSMPGQATAEDLLALDFGPGAGAPTSQAWEVAFDPSYGSSTLVGNSEAESVTDCGGSPTQLEIRYIGHGGQLTTKQTPFVPGATVHQYLKRVHLVAARLSRVLVVGGKRVRMSHVPLRGEAIVLAPRNAPSITLGG